MLKNKQSGPGPHIGRTSLLGCEQYFCSPSCLFKVYYCT